MPQLSKPQAVDRELVRTLYLNGLSTRQVAVQLQVSYSYVGRLCADILRDHSTAAKLRQPMKPSTHWRTCRAQARRLTELELGRALERWEHVHHINGDYTDQRRENREVRSAGDHARHHHPANPTPRHLRPVRRAYMKQYLHDYRQRRKNATPGKT